MGDKESGFRISVRQYSVVCRYFALALSLANVYSRDGCL